ncbi:MAG: EF-hand domain-containing protein [Alphaproteobacteria bacterium]|nr:EF-hand domain-containing protein [Alphaproteobacteria bacterium]
MRKFWLIVAVCVLFSGAVAAKYNPPHNYITNSQKTAMYQMNMYDADHDGRLSQEEFENKTSVADTRETRRQIRNAKKAGIYQEPDEQFKSIDSNNDGYITLPEMDKYISEQTQKTKGKVKYY